MNLTLPTDSTRRKEFPVFSGVLAYFPAAIARIANWSKRGNDKHNPGEPLHHARGKSMDHRDCIPRHLMDLADMEAALDRGDNSAATPDLGFMLLVEQLLDEATALAWRSNALLQELCEKYGGAPLAPGARLPQTAAHVSSPVVPVDPVRAALQKVSAAIADDARRSFWVPVGVRTYRVTRKPKAKRKAHAPPDRRLYNRAEQKMRDNGRAADAKASHIKRGGPMRK